MRFTSALFSLAALLGAAVDARSATGDRILVVRDEKYSSGYNKFFESLKGEYAQSQAASERAACEVGDEEYVRMLADHRPRVHAHAHQAR
jgi:hypothetical protein